MEICYNIQRRSAEIIGSAEMKRVHETISKERIRLNNDKIYNDLEILGEAIKQINGERATKASKMFSLIPGVSRTPNKISRTRL